MTCEVPSMRGRQTEPVQREQTGEITLTELVGQARAEALGSPLTPAMEADPVRIRAVEGQANPD